MGVDCKENNNTNKYDIGDVTSSSCSEVVVLAKVAVLTRCCQLY